MKLILARHGNTFEADQPAYYVGSQQDLPLVEFGKAQAVRLGKIWAQYYPNLAAVYTGPLRRMIATAEIALQTMSSDICSQIDTRLNELDYGLWSGLTSAEVKQRFGEEDYERWEKHSQWPQRGEWGESEAAVIERIQCFAQEITSRYLPEQCVCVVASGGCLRYFLTLIPHKLEELAEKQQLKIATGRMCVMQYQHGQWQLESWNQ